MKIAMLLSVSILCAVIAEAHKNQQQRDFNNSPEMLESKNKRLTEIARWEMKN